MLFMASPMQRMQLRDRGLQSNLVTKCHRKLNTFYAANLHRAFTATKRGAGTSYFIRVWHVPYAATGFHQERMIATHKTTDTSQIHAKIRVAESDQELQAAAWLRAQSFYVYPPERKFAGELHQTMMAEQEYATLKAAMLQQKLGNESNSERSACLVALCDLKGLELDKHLYIEELQTSGGAKDAVVGTLDLHVARALPGEVLIGNSSCAGYLANVCVAPSARRRGVGELLIVAARELSWQWGVQDLFVHTMAVNEAALRFYNQCGFVIEKEETPNQAHYRGRCLDGIEGRGRTILLRDSLLHSNSRP